MKLESVGNAGLQGWRGKVGDAVAGRVSSRTSVREDQVRAAVGILFLVLAVMYVIRALKELFGTT